MQRELCGMKFKKRLRFRSPLSIGLSGTVLLVHMAVRTSTYSVM